MYKRQNLDNVNVAGVSTFASTVDINGDTTFGANGSITSAANFTLSGNKLRVTGSDTVGIECQRASNATIQCTETTNNTDLQLRANSTGGLVRTATQKPLILGTYQQERLHITSGGKVLIGSSNHNSTIGSGVGSQLQIEGNTYQTSSLALINNSTSTDPAFINFGKSRAGSSGGTTIVQNGDRLGGIRFSGADGSDLHSRAAQIEVYVDLSLIHI